MISRLRPYLLGLLGIAAITFPFLWLQLVPDFDKKTVGIVWAPMHGLQFFGDLSTVFVIGFLIWVGIRLNRHFGWEQALARNPLPGKKPGTWDALLGLDRHAALFGCAVEPSPERTDGRHPARGGISLDQHLDARAFHLRGSLHAARQRPQHHCRYDRPARPRLCRILRLRRLFLRTLATVRLLFPVVAGGAARLRARRRRGLSARPALPAIARRLPRHRHARLCRGLPRIDPQSRHHRRRQGHHPQGQLHLSAVSPASATSRSVTPSPRCFWSWPSFSCNASTTPPWAAPGSPSGKTKSRRRRWACRSCR